MQPGLTGLLRVSLSFVTIDQVFMLEMLLTLIEIMYIILKFSEIWFTEDEES